jgi:hypothetical protein
VANNEIVNTTGEGTVTIKVYDTKGRLHGLQLSKVLLHTGIISEPNLVILPA